MSFAEWYYGNQERNTEIMLHEMQMLKKLDNEIEQTKDRERRNLLDKEIKLKLMNLSTLSKWGIPEKLLRSYRHFMMYYFTKPNKENGNVKEQKQLAIEEKQVEESDCIVDELKQLTVEEKSQKKKNKKKNKKVMKCGCIASSSDGSKSAE